MGIADTVRAGASAVAGKSGGSGSGSGGAPGSTNIADAIRAIGDAVASPSGGNGRTPNGSTNVADVVAAGMFVIRTMAVDRAVADLDAAMSSVQLRNVLAHDAHARFLLQGLMKRMAKLTSDINKQLGR